LFGQVRSITDFLLSLRSRVLNPVFIVAVDSFFGHNLLGDWLRQEKFSRIVLLIFGHSLRNDIVHNGGDLFWSNLVVHFVFDIFQSFSLLTDNLRLHLDLRIMHGLAKLFSRLEVLLFLLEKLHLLV
jgi:hypothetical protein